MYSTALFGLIGLTLFACAIALNVVMYRFVVLRYHPRFEQSEKVAVTILYSTMIVGMIVLAPLLGHWFYDTVICPTATAAHAAGT